MGQRSYPQCFPLKTDDRRHTSKPGFWHARIESMALNYQKTNGRTLEASSSSPGRAKMDLERFPSGLDANNFKNPWNSLKTYLDWMFAMSNIKMSHHNWIIVFIIVLLDCVEKTSMIGYYIYIYQMNLQRTQPSNTKQPSLSLLSSCQNCRCGCEVEETKATKAPTREKDRKRCNR